MELINNNISRYLQEECAKQVVQGVYIAAIQMMEISECFTVY